MFCSCLISLLKELETKLNFHADKQPEISKKLIYISKMPIFSRHWLNDG